MHVVVIGAGLLGVTSAYFLRQHGVDVTVIEKEPGPALGASYGNGGYLQVSAPDPWNAPGVFGLFAKAWLASIIGKGDRSAFATRTSALPGLTSWGMRFLKNANAETFQTNLIKNMHLAQYTSRMIDDINEQETLSYSRSKTGGLIIFRDEASMAAYVGVAEMVGAQGARFDVLDCDALIAKEPSLIDVSEELVGAVYFPDDSAGNSRKFCEQLASITESQGVSYRYGASVTQIKKTASGVSVTTDRESMASDAVVIAAGVHSKALVKQLGIRLPIAPAKGYSISIPMNGWSNRPRHVIADMGVHAGINPMGDVLRVAGTAEFVGLRPGISTERTKYLIGLAEQVFPGFAKSMNPEDIAPWGGHRPLSADGIPMIGATKVKGVYLNTGHGGLGWTQSAGSGKALADTIVGANAAFDLHDFSVNRFH